jgi:nitrile hydratase
MMARLQAGEAMPVHADPAMAERGLTALRSVHPMGAAPAQTEFAPGQRVRVKRMHPPGHTRCPRYVRGVAGLIESLRGLDRLPDRAVYGERVEPEPVYSVAFGSRDLWGASDEPEWAVRLDLFESYLEPA